MACSASACVWDDHPFSGGGAVGFVTEAAVVDGRSQARSVRIKWHNNFDEWWRIIVY